MIKTTDRGAGDDRETNTTRLRDRYGTDTRIKIK